MPIASILRSLPTTPARPLAHRARLFLFLSLLLLPGSVMIGAIAGLIFEILLVFVAPLGANGPAIASASFPIISYSLFYIAELGLLYSIYITLQSLRVECTLLQHRFSAIVRIAFALFAFLAALFIVYGSLLGLRTPATYGECMSRAEHTITTRYDSTICTFNGESFESPNEYRGFNLN
jgi:hypothetical protein